MTEHDTVQQNNENGLNNCWREKPKIDKNCEKYRTKFLTCLFELENRWNGHLVVIATAELCIALPDINVRPMHSASYTAGQATRHFAAKKIDSML